MQVLFLKCQHQNKEAILSATLGLPIGKIVTDYCSMLVLEAVGVSQELLPPWTQVIRKCQDNLYQKVMDYTDRDIFRNKRNYFYATFCTQEIMKITSNLEVWNLRTKGQLFRTKIPLCLLFTTKSPNKVPYLQPSPLFTTRGSHLQPSPLFRTKSHIYNQASLFRTRPLPFTAMIMTLTLA